MSPAERIVDADPTEVVTRRQGPRLQDGARLVYTVVAPAAITVPAPGRESQATTTIRLEFGQGLP